MGFIKPRIEKKMTLLCCVRQQWYLKSRPKFSYCCQAVLLLNWFCMMKKMKYSNSLSLLYSRAWCHLWDSNSYHCLLQKPILLSSNIFKYIVPRTESLWKYLSSRILNNLYFKFVYRRTVSVQYRNKELMKLRKLAVQTDSFEKVTKAHFLHKSIADSAVACV